MGRSRIYPSDFSNDELLELSSAYEAAVLELIGQHRPASPIGRRELRRAVAAKVIDEAQGGHVEIGQLKDAAVRALSDPSAFPAYRSVWAELRGCR